MVWNSAHWERGDRGGLWVAGLWWEYVLGFVVVESRFGSSSVPQLV